jgi:uncharacterized protein YjbI with pentapeptide repeats
MTNADLSEAVMEQTNLRNANLTGAKNWTNCQSQQAASLEGTIMPSGQKRF